MWILMLNDMRSSNIEILQPVAKAETKQHLLNWLNAERGPRYRDGQWGKVFRRGGPLEWYNEPWGHAEDEHFIDVGERDSFIARAANLAAEQWDEQIAPIPAPPDDERT